MVYFLYDTLPESRSRILFEGLWIRGSRYVLHHTVKYIGNVTMLFIADSFFDVSSIVVGFLDVSWNRRSFVGLYFYLSGCVVYGVSMEAPFF